MKNLTLLLLLTCGLSVSLFAEDKDKPKKDAAFTQHSGEVYVTPSADYFIFTEGDKVNNDDPYEQQYPFVGFGFGAQYLYRPVEIFGISTGVGLKMQGDFRRVPDFASDFIRQRIHTHTGFVTVPLYFHLFKKMPGCTFEFATGPDFNFPVFQRSTVITYSSNAEVESTDKDFTKLKNVSDNASFGLSILLGGEVNLCEHANLFVGPQIQFLNLVYFDKDLNQLYKNNGKNDFISLGLKMGFRFH